MFIMCLPLHGYEKGTVIRRIWNHDMSGSKDVTPDPQHKIHNTNLKYDAY